MWQRREVRTKGFDFKLYLKLKPIFSFLGVRHSGRGAVNNEPETAFEELLYYYVELAVKYSQQEDRSR